METKRNKKNNNIRNNNFARYSSLGFEMLGIIFLGTLSGVKLDEKFPRNFPLFTIILSLFSVFVALYVVLRDVMTRK